METALTLNITLYRAILISIRTLVPDVKQIKILSFNEIAESCFELNKVKIYLDMILLNSVQSMFNGKARENLA